MFTAAQFRKALKISRRLESELKHKYNVALSEGKVSFTLKTKISDEVEIAKDLCKRFNYEITSIVDQTISIRLINEDIRFRNNLFREVLPRLKDAIIYGDNYIIMDENKFSIVRSEPILKCLGFKCEECGNEIWRISF